jgi:prepilin-type N-terminal cleavage/methylation domain-containing protein/prepilin-type processing-associated H-X9-DG protein
MKTSHPLPVNTTHRAFTLIELLVVIAILAMLAALLLPVLSQAKEKGQSVACRSQLRQLQLAWHMYVDDNNGVMPPNVLFDTGFTGWRNLPGSWVLGNAISGVALSDIESGVLYSYTPSPGIYRCPANRAIATSASGVKLPVIRSYSLQYQLNPCGASWRPPPPYYNYTKFSDVPKPAPASLYVFLEPNEASLNDGGYFVTDNNANQWGHLPDELHGHGCNLSFADGHVELYKWKWMKKGRQQIDPIQSNADREDYNRLLAGRARGQ